MSVCEYVGFVESTEEGNHRNIVRANQVTIMRKLATGSYNLHIEGYSYAKSTNELQVFQSLDEAFCWMELIEPSPTNAADESSEN